MNFSQVSIVLMFFYMCVCMCMHVCQCACYHTYVEVKGEPVGVGSLLLLCGLWWLNSALRLGSEGLYP